MRHSASVNLCHGRNVDADVLIHFLYACLFKYPKLFMCFIRILSLWCFYCFILVILSLFCVYIDLLRSLMYMILICVYFIMCWVRDDLINEFNQSLKDKYRIYIYRYITVMTHSHHFFVGQFIISLTWKIKHISSSIMFFMVFTRQRNIYYRHVMAVYGSVCPICPTIMTLWAACRCGNMGPLLVTELNWTNTKLKAWKT